MSNWTNKWILMLLAGIIIQVIVYPAVWFLQIFHHDYFFEVFLVSIFSIVAQIIGFGIIMKKTKDQDPAIYSQGRPFQHKLREEDATVASRKPTYAETQKIE